MNYNEYARLFQATMDRESHPNYDKSFRNWQKNAAVLRKACKMVEQMYENDRVKILKEYSTSKAHEMLAERQAKYLEFKLKVEAELEEGLNAVIESKKARIQKCCKAPLTEDINLLSALNMRSKLSENEIIHAAEAVGDNLVALGTLADISDRHGIRMPIPTAERYEEKLAKAADYARDRISEAFVPESEMSYKGIEFFNFPDAQDGFADLAFKELDNSVFTSEQNFRSDKNYLQEMKETLKAKENGKGKSEDEAK